MEFDLKEIIELLIKRFLLITVCTFTGLLLFLIINTLIIAPSYTASVQMYVNTEETSTTANLSELDYAQKVVKTYINFLETKTFYNQVISESKLNYTEDELRKMTAIKSVNNTEIFEISVTAKNPDDAYLLAQTMQNIVPDLIMKIKDTAEISVVDPVVIPTSPSGPNIFLNTLIGGIIGFILSIIFVFLWEIIDVSVKNQDDLAKKYQLPILGAIPNFKKYNKRRNALTPVLLSFKGKINKKTPKSDNQEAHDDSINDETKFLITEAYKTFRTNLRFTLRTEGCKKVVICSPIPEDGKSTTSANIAITIAQTGAKVLLIDCDLRKGRLHNFFELNSSPGISDCLSGLYDVKSIVQSTTYSNLRVITMGTIPPNPTELLASLQMDNLLKQLEKEYEYIIIDTPPVNVVSDSLSLVKMVDGVIIVVREGVTSHPNITNAITKYEFVKANLLGFVINSVSLNQGKGYYSNYNYYYYKKHD